MLNDHNVCKSNKTLSAPQDREFETHEWVRAVIQTHSISPPSISDVDDISASHSPHIAYGLVNAIHLPVRHVWLSPEPPRQQHDSDYQSDLDDDVFEFASLREHKISGSKIDSVNTC
jgi:hypothetical protein